MGSKQRCESFKSKEKVEFAEKSFFPGIFREFLNNAWKISVSNYDTYYLNILCLMDFEFIFGELYSGRKNCEEIKFENRFV